jgi:hypothetical protein
MNKVLVMLVFFHQQSPCTWSLPCLYKQNTLWFKCEGVNLPILRSGSSEHATSFDYYYFTWKTLVWHVAPSSWYMHATLICIICTLNMNQDHTWNKLFEKNDEIMTCLWHLEIEAYIKNVPYTYTYACGKNIFIGQS